MCSKYMTGHFIGKDIAKEASRHVGSGSRLKRTLSTTIQHVKVTQEHSVCLKRLRNWIAIIRAMASVDALVETTHFGA